MPGLHIKIIPQEYTIVGLEIIWNVIKVTFINEVNYNDNYNSFVVSNLNYNYNYNFLSILIFRVNYNYKSNCNTLCQKKL